MRTFYEYFLDEIQRRQDAGEIDSEKARRWVAEIQTQLQEYAEYQPAAPIVQMPVQHYLFDFFRHSFLSSSKWRFFPLVPVSPPSGPSCAAMCSPAV